MNDDLSTVRKLTMKNYPAVQAVLFGLLVMVLLIASDQLSMHFGVRESQRVVDDAFGGMIAGLTLYLNARRRLQFIAERLKTVALMNHHVRNALQVIRDAHYIQNSENVAALIEDAVTRIDWALREVLPGAITTETEFWNRDSNSQSRAGRAGKPF